MNSIPHFQARSSVRPAFALLSVLALLALACFPVLAQADSIGPQYETEVPTVTGHTTPPTKTSGGGTPANSSTAGGGSTHTNASGSGSGDPSGASNNPSTDGGDGTGQGSQGNGSTAGKGSGQQVGSLAGGQPVSSQSASDDSSSPLIPILIAIAALAAISIGAVVIRQRRQRQGSGARVSPKAS
jgi:cobalamin biosynthesis Mg chelatase CobN